MENDINQNLENLLESAANKITENNIDVYLATSVVSFSKKYVSKTKDVVLRVEHSKGLHSYALEVQDSLYKIKENSSLFLSYSDVLSMKLKNGENKIEIVNEFPQNGLALELRNLGNFFKPLYPNPALIKNENKKAIKYLRSKKLLI